MYREKNTHKQRRKCVAEQRNRTSKQGIKAVGGCLYVQPEQPAPERPESTKRGRSVNCGGEVAWSQERRQRGRAVVLLVRDAGPWDLHEHIIHEIIINNGCVNNDNAATR